MMVTRRQRKSKAKSGEPQGTSETEKRDQGVNKFLVLTRDEK